MSKKINIEKENGRIYIYTPYNKTFVNEIKMAGGRWNGEAWAVHEDALDTAREILMDIYGETDIYTPELVNVKLTFSTERVRHRESYELFGRSIVIATGRDSGAWLGEDCALVRGEIKSGGSSANWTTIIEPGTEIIVYDVPVDLAEQYDENFCKIISEKTVNVDELIKEREKLLARIAEIDTILKNEEQQKGE